MCDLVCDDEDAARVYHEVQRIARRAYVCGECRMPIVVGGRYVRISGLSEGAWWHGRAHVECLELARHIATDVCGGASVLVGGGILRDEVREHQQSEGVLRRWRDILRARRAEGSWPVPRAA